MRYFHSITSLFQNPHWGRNLLLFTVCLLIPIIGPIVLIGYYFEMIDSFLGLLRAKSLDPSEVDEAGVMNVLPVDPQYADNTYPDFQFNRFGEYLYRGIWPFLVGFLFNLIVGVLSSAIFVGGMILVGVNYGGKPGMDATIIAIYGFCFLIYLFLLISVGILSLPIYVRAGITGEFAGAFSLKFYRGFMQRVGKEVVLANLFLAVVSPVITGVGLLMCYFGMFPAMALFQYAHHHLEYQLYQLYLERGGEPLVRKDERTDRLVGGKPSSEYILRPQDEIQSADRIRLEDQW
jgi:hypothetical protein